MFPWHPEHLALKMGNISLSKTGTVLDSDVGEAMTVAVAVAVAKDAGFCVGVILGVSTGVGVLVGICGASLPSSRRY